MKNRIHKISYLLLLSCLLFSCFYASNALNVTPTPIETPLGDDLKLSMIQVDSQDIVDFDSNNFNYIVEIPVTKMPSNDTALLNMIKGETVNPEAFIVKLVSEEANTITLNTYINFETSSISYTVTLVPERSSSSSSSRRTIPQKILETNTKLRAINIENTDPLVVQKEVLNNLSEIKRLVSLVEDPTTAELVYKYLGDTMGIVGSLMGFVEDNNPIVKQVSDVTDYCRKLVFVIENPTVNGDLTENYFNNMRHIIYRVKSHEYESKNLKNQIFKLGDQAVNKTGEFKIPSYMIHTSQATARITFKPTDITSHITLAQKEFNKINQSMISLLGSSNPRNLEQQITLSINKPSSVDSIEIEIEKTLLALISDKGYAELGVNSGEAGIKFSNKILNNNEDSLYIHTTFENSDSINNNSYQIPIPNGKIANISMKSNKEPKTKFSSPIDLKFDLNQWNLNNLSDNALNNLSFFVLNETTNNWDIVGGNFDPITKTIKVMRMSLSKYTVMQSQKAFSDLEHAWAKDEINELLGKGIIDEAPTFEPNKSITREDFTVWVSNAYGLKKDDLIVPFEDIYESDPHFIQLSTAYSLGVINGKSDTIFDPNGNITREEISTIVSNALKEFDNKSYNPQLVQNLKKYQDFNEISNWAKNTVSLVDELGIMRGDDVTFRPKDNVTRQEAASIIKRFYN